MCLQNRVDNTALHTDASAVNNADFVISLQYGLMQIFLNQVRYLPGLERVQIYAFLYGQFYRFRHSNSSSNCKTRKKPLDLTLLAVHFLTGR